MRSIIFAFIMNQTKRKWAHYNTNTTLNRMQFPNHIVKRYYKKSSAVAEMGDCLTTIDMGWKLAGWGCCASFRGGRRKLGPHVTQCCLGQGLPLYQEASWSIQPFGHNRNGPQFIRSASVSRKSVGCCAPFHEGAESTSNTQTGWVSE